MGMMGSEWEAGNGVGRGDREIGGFEGRCGDVEG